MAASGGVSGTNLLLAQRLLTGIGSALIFISGGVLAARLASTVPRDAGLVLGLYYGGTGWGIVVSSILVPLTLSNGPRGWQSAWFALAFACALFAAVSIGAARRLDADRATAAPSPREAARRRHLPCGRVSAWRWPDTGCSGRLHRLHDFHRCPVAQFGDE
jgi:MFS family permease